MITGSSQLVQAEHDSPLICNGHKPADRRLGDAPVDQSDQQLITIDIGGAVFRSQAHILRRALLFQRLLSEQADQHRIFVERDPAVFAVVLNYLRDPAEMCDKLPKVGAQDTE